MSDKTQRWIEDGVKRGRDLDALESALRRVPTDVLRSARQDADTLTDWLRDHDEPRAASVLRDESRRREGG